MLPKVRNPSRDKGDTCQISHEPEKHPDIGHRGDKVKERDFGRQIEELFKYLGWKLRLDMDGRQVYT